MLGMTNFLVWFTLQHKLRKGYLAFFLPHLTKIRTSLTFPLSLQEPSLTLLKHAVTPEPTAEYNNGLVMKKWYQNILQFMIKYQTQTI